MRILNFHLVILVIISLFGCKETSEKNLTTKDSTIINQSDVDSAELTTLIRNVYNW